MVVYLAGRIKLSRNFARTRMTSQRGQARRRLASVACLLEGIRQTQQLVLAPGAPCEGDAERIIRRVFAVERSRDEAAGHHDAGIARLGGDRRASCAWE